MKVSIIIPQLFFDLIGRVVPGFLLIGMTLICLNGFTDGLRLLSNWALAEGPEFGIFSLTFTAMLNILSAYVLGVLLGGVWFRLYRLKKRRAQKDSDKRIKYSLYEKPWTLWLNGWSGNGERLLMSQFSSTCPNRMKKRKGINLDGFSSTQLIAFMYDYVQMTCPNMSGRIAKLRAEKHMSGVLMVGLFILIVTFAFDRELVYQNYSWLKTELVLFAAMLASGWFAWHLEKRSMSAVYFTWLLTWSGVTKEIVSSSKESELSGTMEKNQNKNV